MRKTASLAAALVLAAGLLVASPALAAFGAVVQLPASVFYGPYGGPATVTFTFAPTDTPTIFTIRLREPGKPAIRKKDVLVDPTLHAFPHDVPFSWPDLTATTPTDYVIDVRRQDDATVITSETFTVLPKLVSGVSAKPSPFYPLIDDGYKDSTKIRFSLSADTLETVVRVFADDATGRCCGPELRTADLGGLSAGDRVWVWDGRKDDASLVAKGTYYVRVGATDTEDRSFLASAQKVEVAKGVIRLTATKEKAGSAYARVGDVQETARGGSCLVSRDRLNRRVNVLCANAEVSIVWKWALQTGERIESASFTIDGGIYGCHRRIDHTRTESTLRVLSPPTSTCYVTKAKITYSYPVQV
ncbi:MAG TPA: FlgD immunoglobulin-like domain containing protein [Actinomycetota bacterium]